MTQRVRRRALRALGLGVVTGACDDDPSAIGTYASAGATLGYSFLWTAPVTFPMMYAVVYLSAKLGQVSGKGLFDVIKSHYPRWLLWPALIGVLIGNVIEASADLGGMAAAINLLVGLPLALIVAGVAIIILLLQIYGSYELIRNVFRWLALGLFAYLGAAILAKPDAGKILAGTFYPHIVFNRQSLSLLVAVLGTTLSAYLYSWQSNVEVEEEILKGRTRLWQRQGATDAELSESKHDIIIGMAFSNLIMYFIILAASATLFTSGKTDISTAAQAAEALRPLAGRAASLLFTVGIVGAGFLAVPIMIAGGAYDLCQVAGWKSSLHARPHEAKQFYAVIVALMAVAVGLNFLGFNPMKALVWSGIVQGFSTPPLLLLIMLLTNNPAVMGDRVNSLWTNILGWTTTAVTFLATAALVATWLL